MSDKKFEETVGLFSVGKHGVLVEVGPVGQGLLCHAVIEQTRAAVEAILDVLDATNRGAAPELPDRLMVFRRGEAVDYPRDREGAMTAVVHRRLQGRDFEPLRTGDVIFHVPGGKDIRYEDEETVFPVFINEAAYYEKGMAFRITRRVEISL